MKTNTWLPLDRWTDAPPQESNTVLVFGELYLGKKIWSVWTLYPVKHLKEKGCTHFMILDLPVE